ncbi:MAG TPA: hypothetical protein VIP28_06015 [Nocardioides sp.]
MAKAPMAPVPVREKGFAHDGTGGFWVDLTNETTPELMWPLSVFVYDRMRRQDAQVSSVLRAVTSPILRTAWSIDGAGCRDEVTERVARNLGLPIRGAETEGDNTAGLRGRDRFSWSNHTRLALTMLPFGHAFFEQVYRIAPDGYADLRKLAFRPQRTISQINVARDGGLVSLEQNQVSGLPVGGGISGSRASAGIPVNRLVAYVLDREGGNWLGISLLRPAYKNWLLKDRALRSWSISIDRNGVGVPVYEAAPKELSLDAGQDIATKARGGSNAGAAIPNGADLSFKGVEGMTVDINAFVRYQDEQIARAVLAHFLNLGTQTGSWALGSTFADFFTLSLQAIAEDYRDVSNAHIVEDLVDVNYGPDEPAPRIHFDEIGSRGGVDTELEQLRQLAGLDDDDALTEFLRQHVMGGGTSNDGGDA